MKTTSLSLYRSVLLTPLLSLALLTAGQAHLRADPATVLFRDDFTGGIPGWTAVQPAGGVYVDGPMLWEYDKSADSYSEQSNIYTDSSAYSTTRFAVMLINNTVAPGTFTYTARVTAGDDDGFGLIFGYQNETTFYRVQFARQTDANRNTHWPFYGWNVDRMNDRQITDLFGNFTNTYPTFVNTAGRPYDVTIAVTNNLFTLTIVDDPLGFPTIYNLVTDGQLPSSATGKVGMFSWGMGGTVGGIRSFRIQNPVLWPTPLAGNPASQVLSNWSFLTTPRTDGTIPAFTGGPALWAQALGPNGDRGVMMENSDWTADNVVTANTNFAAPVAVAGDVSWTNYVYSARFLNTDNDGFGMLLRYQNETNFYRIALRNQNAQTGIKRGVSVQKNVNLVFDQLYSNSVAGFIPPIDGTPYEVHAFIRTNTLQIIAINNPDGTSPTVAASGAINMGTGITSATLDNGKVGIFSWAMYSDNSPTTVPDDGMAVDWVKVRTVSGEGLLVSSPYGTPDPPIGLNDFPIGSAITAKVDSVVFTEPGVRRVLTGWTGAGSVPASGTTNQATITLNAFSSVTWKWRTEYQLSVSATPGGTVSFLGTQYLPSGTNVVITATNNPGYLFLGWTGASVSQTTNLTVSMTQPINLLARFTADSDGDGLPDEWEMAFFGNLSQGATGDPDGDGKNNLTEYLLGTNPGFAEPLAFTDGLSSRWINETRDRGLPGWFVVTNFGSGFRGIWEDSNYNRYANDGGLIGYPFITTTNFGTNASFQGPMLLVRTNVWNPAWANTFALSAEYSVGDDDGSCLYFRYLNESNWYRVTIAGQYQNTGSPLLGVSIQKRTNGYFSAVSPISDNSANVFTDPLDYSGFKKVRMTVNATNDLFEVRVIGWDTRLGTPDWNPSWERIITFQDNGVAGGRIGIGDWGMDGFGAWNATNGIPVGAGMFVDNITLMVDGTNAFVEDWEAAALHTDIPPGWENPYASAPPNTIGGDWHISAHGTIANFTDAYGSAQSGTLAVPKGDVEGPILLAPAPTNANYVLELGITPWDDGGMGFVYDFVDTNNFSRVLFDQQVPLAGQLPQGLNVSRKSGGVWKDIVVGDTLFVYTPGRPFDVRFANNNGVYTLLAWNSDAPAAVYRWQWAGPPAAATNRFGLALWNMPDAHFSYLRASALPTSAELPFRITRVSTAGGNVVLDISKPLWSLYSVQRASAVGGPYATVATSQSGTQYSEPLPGVTAFYRLVLAP